MNLDAIALRHLVASTRGDISISAAFVVIMCEITVQTVLRGLKHVRNSAEIVGPRIVGSAVMWHIQFQQYIFSFLGRSKNHPHNPMFIRIHHCHYYNINLGSQTHLKLGPTRLVY